MREDKRLLKKFKSKVSGLLRPQPAVKCLDQDTLDAAVSHRSFDSMAGILAWLLTLAKGEFEDFTIDGCRALEIGSGKFLTNALGLYICGCSEVVAIDKYRQLLPAAVKLAMSKPVLARRFLSPHVSHDEFIKRLRETADTEYDLKRLEALGIKYRAPLDLADAGAFHGAFDVVFSYTVLEHVPADELVTLLEKSVSTLRPGAFCIHFVDLEDHLDSQSNPFQFLNTDNIDWKDEQSFARGNRLRFSTWKKHFSEFEDVDWRFPYIAVRHDVDLPSTIDSSIEYIDDEDLRTTAFVVVGRRLR